MFVKLLSGALSFRFIIPIVIGVASLFGYSYYTNTNKTALKQQLEIANAHIASFDAEIGNHKRELDERNKTISLLEKEVEKEKQIGKATQFVTTNLVNANATLSAQYRIALDEVNRLRQLHSGGCINEIISNDILTTVNGGVRQHPSNENSEAD